VRRVPRARRKGDARYRRGRSTISGNKIRRRIHPGVVQERPRPGTSSGPFMTGTERHAHALVGDSLPHRTTGGR